MKICYRLFLLFLVLSPLAVFGQKPDTLIKKLDSLSIRSDSLGSQKNNISQQAYNAGTRIRATDYFILLTDDFKQGITKPFHMKGKDWRNLGIIAATAGALSLVDEPVQQMALRLRSNSVPLRNVSTYVTRFGGRYEAYVLLGLGAYGFIFHDVKMQTTTLLATQSYIPIQLLMKLNQNSMGHFINRVTPPEEKLMYCRSHPVIPSQLFQPLRFLLWNTKTNHGCRYLPMVQRASSV
jgi:hypothetical protein